MASPVGVQVPNADPQTSGPNSGGCERDGLLRLRRSGSKRGSEGGCGRSSDFGTISEWRPLGWGSWALPTKVCNCVAVANALASDLGDSARNPPQPFDPILSMRASLLRLSPPLRARDRSSIMGGRPLFCHMKCCIGLTSPFILTTTVHLAKTQFRVRCNLL